MDAIVGDALLLRVEGGSPAAEAQVDTDRVGATPNRLFGIVALPQSFRQRRAVVGRMRIGGDGAEFAGGVKLSDGARRGSRRSSAADAQRLVSRHSAAA